MTADRDRLYALLPSVVRRRDAEQGWPLRALLGVVQEQADVIEADIEQLYDDWFIETCQGWVAPYLGELVGYRVLPGSAEALTSPTKAAQRLLAAIAGRRDVAHTVADRRRKGTLALLEQLAADVAGWPARAVEFRTLLGLTQPVRLLGRDPRADRRSLARGRTVDLHAVDALDRIDGPFDRLARTVDVRRINSARTQGRYNLPEVGLFLWRLRPYPVTRAPAHCDDRARTHFTFSVLGNSAPLIVKPVGGPSPAHLADESTVPAFIRRLAFAERTAQFYGPGKSLCVYVGGEPVPLHRIVPADLTGWRHHPANDQVAIDPVLGRIAFPARHAPTEGVWVDYHYGFSADLGGGEYVRPLDLRRPAAFYRVGRNGEFTEIGAALRQWQADKAADPGKREAVIEITDAGDYLERLAITLEPDDRLTLRAAQGARPVLRVLDWNSNRPDALHVVGPPAKAAGKPPRITFDGLLVAGRGLRISGGVGAVVLRHCTLVPGWSLDQECNPEHAEEASVELADTPACLQVEHSILGPILVNADEVHAEPNTVWLSDSILDATGPGPAALSAPDRRPAHAVVSIRRTTVFGAVLTHGVGLVENSIVTGCLRVDRRQSGCVRFCWLGPGSRTPRRFHCLPAAPPPGAPQPVVPRFTSTRYGTPGYAQLAPDCPEEIRRGADDGSEPGAFHDLFQPQREDNLRLRLAEYVPAGCDAGLVLVT
ncbi:hypothetical protein [Kitasatospora aureofaciens]|uniref:hypothetical protein n=1 Tax=Kitasatospora aureofaciens TaxID=1894 RepID=UPI001C462064|nr:hypothetical protein [Kitasatospora aureofaciens]MBV6696775.1 hypothetical protein [Kitasatospora aureofaciens]